MSRRDIEIIVDRRPLALDRGSRDLTVTVDRSSFAFDLSSARSIDVDGRMEIKDCRISKANVCEYAGAEIPDWQALGLQADKSYRMYRDAGALRKSAATFENLPLMSEHIGVDANNPQKYFVVGAVSNVRWQAPYLVADLKIWDADAIAKVKDGSCRELSPGYRYVPIMQAGIAPDGEQYDGIMSGPIIANHLAVVPVGRTGPDVMVADSIPIFTNDTAGALKRIEYETRHAQERDPMAQVIPNYYRLP